MRVVFIFLFSIPLYTLGQDTLTLQDCFDRAMANELQFANETAALDVSKIEKRFQLWQLLPDLSASTSFNTSFGRRLDPFTNTFATTNVNSQSFGLNSNTIIFNGFKYVFENRKSVLAERSAAINLDEIQNQLSVDVAKLYVEVCQVQSQIEQAFEKIRYYDTILDLQRMLLKEGRLVSIDTLRTSNAILREKTALRTFQKDLRQNVLELFILINIPLNSHYAFDSESISQSRKILRFASTFDAEQLKYQSQILLADYKIGRSSSLPSLVLNGIIGTGYSTNNKDYTNPGFPTKRYYDQVNQNLYQGIGLFLNLPIFNKGEILKSRQILKVQSLAIDRKLEFVGIALEREEMNIVEEMLERKAVLLNKYEIAKNLKAVYDQTEMLYLAGRIGYLELDLSLMEWQSELQQINSLQLEYDMLKLFTR